MNIDGKENVKERIKIFENDDFITYLYKFKNGNQYNDTVSKLREKIKKVSRKNCADTRLANNYWKKI